MGNNFSLDLCLPIGGEDAGSTFKHKKSVMADKPLHKPSNAAPRKPRAVMSAKGSDSFFVGSKKNAFKSDELTYGSGGKLAFFLLFVLGAFLSTEWRLDPAKALLKEVRAKAVNPSMFNAPQVDGALVHTFGKAFLQVDSGLKDPLFGRDFGDFVEFSRVPEYCQWKATRRVVKEVAGQDPEGKDILVEVEKSVYEKDWRAERIDSSSFPDPVAYHNPQRDPAPPLTVRTTEDLTFSPESAGEEGPNTTWFQGSDLSVGAEHLAELFAPEMKEKTKGEATAVSLADSACGLGLRALKTIPRSPSLRACAFGTRFQL